MYFGRKRGREVLSQILLRVEQFQVSAAKPLGLD